VTGYQYGSPGAFNLHGRPPINSPDDNYVDGVSITHGMPPRTHIWTYAAGVSGATSSDHSGNCPCANPAAATNVLPPHFIGDNYFCESGNQERRTEVGSNFFADDPLWDGEQCEGECCSNGKSPPWFSVTLPNPTSDDIEVRICGDEGIHNEDSPVQLLEIFVQ
jgi:dynein heavy chain